MLSRSAVSVFALVIAFFLGAALSSGPMPVAAQPAGGGHGKCVGVAAHNGVAYRAFEDGTVEAASAGPDGRWRKIGK
jgi:hypothetical protein